MKINDEVVVLQHNCPIPNCGYIGKHGRILSSYLHEGKKRFKIQFKDGTFFHTSRQRLESLTSHKERMIKELGKELLQTLREEIDSCVILRDLERLEKLVLIISMHMNHSVITALRKKGFSKEITELCDKAGMTTHKKFSNVIIELCVNSDTSLINKK